MLKKSLFTPIHPRRMLCTRPTLRLCANRKPGTRLFTALVLASSKELNVRLWEKRPFRQAMDG